MRRLFTILFVVLVVCSATPLFALTDSVYPYGEVPEYKVFEKAVKEAKDYETTASLYKAYLAVCKDAYAVQKGEYEFVKYLVDAGIKKEAEEHLALQKAATDELKAIGGFLADAAFCDYCAIRYYVHKDLNYALDNNEALKKLYKNYPDEVITNLNEAWRNFYAPGIAGGSKKKAIELFSLLIDMGDKINEDILYSAYSGMVSIYVDKKEWAEAKKYLDLAYSIYYEEPYLKDLESKINKKLK